LSTVSNSNENDLPSSPISSLPHLENFSPLTNSLDSPGRALIFSPSEYY